MSFGSVKLAINTRATTTTTTVASSAPAPTPVFACRQSILLRDRVALSFVVSQACVFFAIARNCVRNLPSHIAHIQLLLLLLCLQSYQRFESLTVVVARGNTTEGTSCNINKLAELLVSIVSVSRAQCGMRRCVKASKHLGESAPIAMGTFPVVVHLLWRR